MSDDYLDKLALSGLDAPPARGGVKRKKDIELVYLRELNPADIDALRSCNNLPVSQIKKLNHSHHTLARLLAEGKKPQECHFITGYSSSRISILQNDPQFKELVEYYKTQVAEQYVDVHERLAGICVDGLEILHERMQEGELSNREILDLTEMAADRSIAPAKGGKNAQPQGQAPVNLSISFVNDQPRGLVIEQEAKLRAVPELIEGKVNK